MRAGAMILAMLAMTGPAAADTIQLFAAGSLKTALTEVAKAYEAASGNKVEARYGPSGLHERSGHALWPECPPPYQS